MSSNIPHISSISPTPTDEEAAAIVAALEFGWPRAVAAEPTNNGRSTSWRFSGRWWATHSTLRRARPGI